MTSTVISDPREISLRLESEFHKRILICIRSRSCAILLFSLRRRRRIDHFRQCRIKGFGGAVPAVVNQNI